MKLLLLLLAGLVAMTVIGCRPPVIELGQIVTGTITTSDADDEEWKSKTYVIDVREGVQYFLDLTTKDGNVVGVWSGDIGDYIIEVSPTTTTRSVPYIFNKGGSQEIFIQSPASQVPSTFTFKIWSP